MNETSVDWSLQKFGIGQPVPRTEDPKLVRGEGRYTDDVNLPGQAYAAIVRSRHAHGVIRKIDLAPARAMPGVIAAYTGADLSGYGPLKCNVGFKNRDGSDMKKPKRPALASDKVRFVGDPIAFVVAETPGEARDAAEAVEVEIDPLPAVTRASEAAKEGAPELYADAPGNVALDYHYGDADKVKAAFAAAAHVTKLDLVNSRIVVNAMEPRAAVAAFDPGSGRFTVHTGCQGAFGMRGSLADILGVPADKLHVLVGNVGGSFGMKAAPYPEYVCALHAARALGRPVKWTADRFESFLADHHGRDHAFVGELALDEKGHFLAARFTGYGNMGAYLGAVSPIMSTMNIVKNAMGVYRTPLIEVSTKCMFTNTMMVSAYRGAGRPEGNYYMERLIDAAASEMGIDRLSLRRRNHVRPSEMPYAAASGMTYDSGEFTKVLDRAVELADWDGFKARKREAKKRGKLRGIGVGSYLEVTAPPNKEMGGLRFEGDKQITLVTGTLDYGQGHAAGFAQTLASRLGVPFEHIRLVQGDSDQLVFGAGTGGSRSMMMSGAAIAEVSKLVIEKGKQLAADALEAAAADIEFSSGRYVVAGTDRSIGLIELARRYPGKLDTTHVTEVIPSAFPNGCHVCEVEIDPETGKVEIVRYSSVNDFGTVVNPLTVEGQVHGGVVQGIGQCLMENARYDEEGQLLTGSFMDYALPRAEDIKTAIEWASHPVPATTNPLGAKGCGEAGCAGAMTSVMNAVVDALRPHGIHHLDMPASAPRVWAALRNIPY
ncbi:MAG: xanthine dehydrogenase family protein molybdopterin-binding subunit [Betaproteobacteria bacterium]|nr:MAG: xanthine dehydrogenase family protein molybdopterin-binding subunit [Betaproteobacteria bacterium]